MSTKVVKLEGLFIISQKREHISDLKTFNRHQMEGILRECNINR